MAAILWCGGTVCLSAFLFQESFTPEILHVIDRYVIIPGAILLMGTGIIYNLFTQYGLWRSWIKLKWVIMLFLVWTGIFLPAQKALAVVQLVLMGVLILLSIFRWQRKKQINIRK